MEYNRNLVVNTTESDYYLPNPEDLRYDGYGKITFLMKKPIEMVYDYIICALKLEIEVCVVAGVTHYTIVDTNDLKAVYQILNLIEDNRRYSK